MRAMSLGGMIEPEPAQQKPAEKELAPRYPAGCEHFYWMAEHAGLSCPLGRALYACNRKQNGWRHGVTPIDLMTRASQETAERWLDNWRRGGGVRRLLKEEGR